MIGTDRRCARSALVGVAFALSAGACSSASGEPVNTAPDIVSYSGVPSIPAPDDRFAGLPTTVWSAVGATVSYQPDSFDVEDFGANPDDSESDSEAINLAIQAAHDAGGGVVNIGEGTFVLTDSVRLASRVTLRGEGRATRLELDLNDQSGYGILASGTADEEWTSLESDLQAGTSALTIDVPEETSLVEIEQENTDDIITKPKWDVEWGERAEGELSTLTGRDDSGSFTTAVPLISSYSVERGARVRAVQPVEDVGIESLTIVRRDEGYGHMISLRFTRNAWVYDVVSTRTSFAHVGIEQSVNCTVANSVFHDATDFGDGGRAYGVSLSRHTTSCLVANNTLYELRHALILQLGASGNVIAYNHARGSAGYEDRRPRADISLHGHWPQKNLFEGNIVDRIEVGDWWGPAGPANTFLRNCVLDHVVVLDSSEDQNFIGNIFGTGGVTIDESVEETTFISNDGGPVLNPDSDSTLPVSLWRSDAPQFLGGEWPPIDPSSDSPACDLPASGRSPIGNR
ncbi:MAG: glycosyl hydrolase family 28-related protein [Acidimicrobiales bacterium]